MLLVCLLLLLPKAHAGWPLLLHHLLLFHCLLMLRCLLLHPLGLP